MGDLFLTIYVCTYVRTWYVQARSGMLMRVSCRPIEYYLLRGLNVARATIRSVDECTLAEQEQLHMESNSRHLFIPQLHNNLAWPEARVQASGPFSACRARAATCGVEQ